LLPLEISDKQLENPVVKELETIAIEMIAVANDIVSFNVEQARGDIHNVIIVLMNENKALSIQAAMEVVGDWYKQRGRHFVKYLAQLPSPNDGNSEIQCLHQYAWSLGNWVTANYEWSFESQRYFGEQNSEVRKHGIVELLPKHPQLLAV